MMNEQIDFYKVELMNPNNEKEFVFYRKEKEKFVGDYAIVKAYSKNIKYANQVWSGIINKNFDTVWNFEQGNKIERLKENHFLILNHDSSKHIHLTKMGDKEEAKCLCVMGRYQRRVSENLLIVYTYHSSEVLALYDVSKAKFISNCFTEIGVFQEVDGKKMALARRRLNVPRNSNLLYPLDAMCYIDIEGNICSLVYNPMNHDYEKVSSNDFESWISKLEEKILPHESISQIEKHLKRKLIK